MSFSSFLPAFWIGGPPGLECVRVARKKRTRRERMAWESGERIFGGFVGSGLLEGRRVSAIVRQLELSLETREMEKEIDFATRENYC